MANTETTVTSDRAWRPDLSAFAPTDVIPDALILQHSTVAGSIEGDAPSVRVAFVDDDDAAVVEEGVAIDEGNPDLSEAVVYTSKIAQLIRLSREQWSQSDTSEQLAASVRRAVVKKSNSMFLTQAAPVGPAVAPPAGIVNFSSIVDGGAIADDLDALIDLIAQLEANGGNPSAIITSPTAWASLRKLKTGTTSAQSLLGAGTSDAARMLLDLPVVVTPAMTGGNGVVVDTTAIVSAVGLVQVATDESVYFTSDSVALRATWRLGWTPVHGDRIGKFTVTGAGDSSSSS